MISNRDTLILVVITVLSTVFALSVYQRDQTVSIEQSKLLISDSPILFDDIQQISIRKNGEVFEFEKNGGSWIQHKPFTYRMDASSMMSLIRAVQGVHLIGKAHSTTDVSMVGLGEGANSISVSDGNEEITVLLGRKTLGGRAYARLGESPLVFVDQSLHRTAIDTDHRFWRDTRLFPNFSIDGVRIERIMNGNRLLLDRTEGRWKMIEPVEVEVDEDLLLEWIGRISVARVSSFVVDTPVNLAMFDLLDPVASFSVRNQQGDTHKLFVGGRVSAGSQDRYVMVEGSPVISKISWDLLSPLFPAPEIFVDSTGSSVSRFDIKQITIRTDGQEIVLERNLDQWLNAEGVHVNRELVDTLLTWLLETKPPAVSIEQYPIESEIATVVFSGYDLMPLDAIRIARLEDGSLILENGDNVLRIHASDAGESLLPFTN